ncbi:transcriptional regulator [Virgibacillus phasianinus]|uniref:Transcriptional regulator n=1 Tax=Virgibacillus phasianinus TaxID=2017483 RepID=A0A220U2Z9_9BACI|nr:GntR family transcriptional regulator [Virgibacillus phasianinus]ASK62415.1 transcriptional regulator [Virgibacillus phasianinus]
MEINKSLSIPLYQQVRGYLKEKIISGEWEVGYQLPTEKELASQFDVSSITIKRAVLELVNEGLLHRQSGKGTFVTQIEEKDISKFVSLKNESWEQHHHPHKLLSFKKDPAGRKVGKLLEIKPDEDVYKINRLKIQNDSPVVIEHSFIPSALFPDLQQSDIDNDLLYNIFIKKYGAQLKKARIYFSTILADEYEANLLEVPIGEQLFVFERYTVTKDNKAVEYSKFVLKQDQSKYFLEVQL